MKNSPVELLDRAVKDWIAYDLPPSEKESLSPKFLDALYDRFAANLKTEEPKPTKMAIKPIFKTKPKLKAKSKKTRH